MSDERPGPAPGARPWWADPGPRVAPPADGPPAPGSTAPPPPPPPPTFDLIVTDPPPPVDPPRRPRRRRRGPLIATVASLAVVAVALLVVAPWDAGRRQAIADQITVWTNPPSAEAEQIADAVQLTDDARRVFFATQPSIESAAAFNGHCEVEGQTVLGCYTSDDRIFVYQVTDERLAGTVEVTAAHELLHAAYHRLSRDERDRVDALVAAAVDAIPADDPVRAVLATYPPGQFADEWHSRLGTEFAELAPELEEYYARYFDDRSVVVAFDEQSTAALDDLQSQIDALVAQIDALGADLDARSAAYERDVATLNDDIEAFNERAQTPGGFASQEEFEDARGRLQARYDALESDRLGLNADTERYNGMIEQLEALDASYADLYSSLDSTRAPDQVGG